MSKITVSSGRARRIGDEGRDCNRLARSRRMTPTGIQSESAESHGGTEIRIAIEPGTQVPGRQSAVRSRRLKRRVSSKTPRKASRPISLGRFL